MKIRPQCYFGTRVAEKFNSFESLLWNFFLVTKSQI